MTHRCNHFVHIRVLRFLRREHSLQALEGVNLRDGHFFRSQHANGVLLDLALYVVVYAADRAAILPVVADAANGAVDDVHARVLVDLEQPGLEVAVN